MNEYDDLITGKPVVKNEYDALIQQNDRRQAVGATVAGRKDMPPEAAAKVIELADRSRLPRDVVERNVQEVERRQQPNVYDELIKNPKLATWLSDPYNQAAVQDDPTFTITDKLLNSLARSWQNLRAGGAMSTVKRNEQLLQNLDDLDKRLESVPPEQIPDAADPMSYRWMSPDQRAKLRADIQGFKAQGSLDFETYNKVAQAIPGIDPVVAAALQAKSASEFWEAFSKKPVEFIATVGAESFFQSVATAAALAVTRNPAVAAGIGGAGSYGMDYGASLIEGLRNEGVNINDRAAIEAAVRDKKLMQRVAQYAHSHAGPVALFDAVAAGRTLSAARRASRAGPVGAAWEAAKNIVEQGALGAAGEAAGQAATGKEFEFGQIAAEFFGETVTAPLDFGGALGGQYSQYLRAKEQQDFFKAIGAYSENSKLRERLPGEMQKLVDELTADGPIENVYIEPRAFVQYFQSKNIDPRVVARDVLGSSEPLDAALAAGHDLQIPTGAYAAKLAGTEHNAALSQDLKFDPTALSAREAESLLNDARAQMERAKQQAADQAQAQSDQRASVQQLVSEALQKNGFETNTADALAAQMEAFFATQADRTGNKEGTMGFFKNYVLRILGRDQQPGQGEVLEQPAFHGSPHRFERFDVSKIGTGEGAQVHGWGLYFAKQKATANRYKQGLSQPMVVGTQPDDLINTEVVQKDKNWARAMEDAQTSVQRTDLIKSKIQRLRQRAREEMQHVSRAMKLNDQANAARHAEAVALAEGAAERLQQILDTQGDMRIGRTGRLYEVDLKVDDSELLDLDAVVPDPFDTQGKTDPISRFLELPVVNEALQEIEGNGYTNNPTGRDLYRMLVRYAQYGDERIYEGAGINYGDSMNPYLKDTGEVNAEMIVSKFMLANGIKGLSYVGKQDGPAMVIFDDALVEIVSFEQSPVKNPFTKSVVQERVYHATNADFKKFHSGAIGRNHPQFNANGFFFANSSTEAESFLPRDFNGGKMTPTQQSNIRPSFINLRNPLVLEAPVGAVVEVMDNPRVDDQTVDAEWLEQNGYDGIIVREMQDGPVPSAGVEYYMVLKPSQIKSAITLDQDQARGRMIKYGDFEYDIQLLASADLSTFLHESGHLYLEVLKNVAAANPDSQTAKDVQTLLKWMGIEKAEDIKTEHHEQFARGIEAYFMEGKAPSVELRSVFARFRAWLMAIYAKISNLDVKLNDDVRAVMDRMFATDAEIAAARRENQITPVFITAEQAGMRPEEFERYLKTIENANRKATEELQSEIMADWTREQKAWFKEQRARVREEVLAEALKRNDVIAYLALRFGKNADGTEIAEPVKLDRASLVAMYGEDSPILPQLRGLNLYRKKDGVAPDVLAPIFGFTSGDELVKGLIKAQTYQADVDAQTDTIMQERYGDIMRDGTLPEEATKAVLNNERAKILHAELKALVRKRNEVAPFVQEERNRQRAETSFGLAMIRGVPSLETFQRLATMRLGAMQVRSISPNQFLIAARRAGAVALDAATKNDFQTAATAKQQELFNMEMYRLSRNAQDEVRKTVEYARSFSKTSTRERLGKAGEDYLDQIDAIVDRFDFRPIPLREVDRRARLADWIEQKERQGVTVDLPPQLVDEAFRKPYKALTYDELIGVRDALKHIDHMAGLKNKLLRSKGERDLQRVLDILESTMRENAKKIDTKKTGIRLPQKEFGRFVGQFFASHRKMSSYVRAMDGYEEGGAVWRYLLEPLNEASNHEATMIHEAGIGLQKVFAPYMTTKEEYKSAVTTLSLGLIERGMYAREHVPSIGQSLSKMERLMVALNTGNEDNLTKLKAGYNWNDEQIKDILAPLTKQDWDFVQGIWDHIDSYWPQIEAKQKRVNGIAPERVEPTTVQTPFGEYKGGYFPLQYEDRLSPQAYGDRAKEAADMMMRGGYTQATTRRGHTKERVQGVRMPVRLDFGVIFEHNYQVIHDLAFHETLIDLNKILGKRQIQTAIIEGYGELVYDQLRSTLEAVAAGDVAAQTAFEKSVNWLRQGTSIAAMGWSVSTAMLQPLGLSQSVSRIGSKWVWKGMSRWLGDAAKLESTMKWIYEQSEFMRNRHVTLSREINEIRNSIKGQTTLGIIGNSYFSLITGMQKIADVPTWVGMYEKMLAMGKTEADAIALADQAVLDSQGGGQIKDMAQIQRGGPLMRLWTNFYSYFNVTYNLTADAFTRTKLKDPASVAALAVDLLLLYSVPAVLGFLVKEGLRGDEPPEDLTQRLLREQASYILGTMVGFREFSSLLQGFYGYEGPTGTRFYSQSVKLIQQAEQGEVDEAALKALNNTAGVLFHYPSGQLQRTVEGYMAWSEGAAGPQAVLLGKPQEAR